MHLYTEEEAFGSLWTDMEWFTEYTVKSKKAKYKNTYSMLFLCKKGKNTIFMHLNICTKKIHRNCKWGSSKTGYPKGVGEEWLQKNRRNHTSMNITF